MEVFSSLPAHHGGRRGANKPYPRNRRNAEKEDGTENAGQGAKLAGGKKKKKQARKGRKKKR